MNHKKIQQLEKEIRDLHYNPMVSEHSFSKEKPEDFFRSFWNVHVKPVIELSKQMADKYGANKEVVWLGAVLHDIARLTDESPHDEVGSRKAYGFVLKNGYDEEIATKVKNIVLKHRCKKYPPETLEEKIVASADAMAHFLPPFYIWFSKYCNKTFIEIMEEIRMKIDRDYNEKIFFEDEKKKVAEHYKVFKSWINYNSHY